MTGFAGGWVLDAPIETCPACGYDQVVLVSPGDDKYWCGACARCWSMTMRGPRRSDPVTCPGCPHRPSCFERLREEIPVWEPADLT